MTNAITPATKTFAPMVDSTKPTLLDELREKSEALRAEGEAARRPLEDGIREIDRILWRAFRWLDEAVGHLAVIRPQVGHSFHLGQIMSLERPRFERAFVSFRRKPVANIEVLEHVELFYRLDGDKPLILRVPPMQAGAIEERLRSSTMPYQYQTEHDERRVVRYGVFHVTPQITSTVRLEPDYREQKVHVALRNIDRFESLHLEFQPDKVNEAALEQLVKFILGESNGFIRLAPLKLIRGMRHEVPVSPAAAASRS